MKLLSVALALFPIIALADESFFFEFAKGSKPTETRLEGNNLHLVHPIRKVEAPVAERIRAGYQGLGPGREYRIQVDLKAGLEDRWAPMAKLGDDIVMRGIYTDSGDPPSYHLQGSDPVKIEAWARELGKLLSVPEDQIEIDLTKPEGEEADANKPIPVPVPQLDPGDEGKPEPVVEAGGISAAEYTDKTQRTIRFKVDGADKEIAAPEGKFWDKLTVCKNKKVAYFILMRGDRGGGWTEDLHRFVAEGPEATGKPKKIPLKTDLKKATISRIHSASDDGSSLLIDLHYMTKEFGDNASYESYPHILNAADGSVIPVKPPNAE